MTNSDRQYLHLYCILYSFISCNKLYIGEVCNNLFNKVFDIRTLQINLFCYFVLNTYWAFNNLKQVGLCGILRTYHHSPVCINQVRQVDHVGRRTTDVSLGINCYIVYGENKPVL